MPGRTALLRSLFLVAAALTAGLVVPSAGRAEAFERTLRLQGVTFRVQGSGEGSQQRLEVRTEGLGKTWEPIRETLDGSITGAEVEDLNSDGTPELLVYVQSAGSGSYGTLRAWSASRGGTLLPISLAELSGSDAEGYMGHDRFAVVETTLSRRFPIYRPGDSNAAPSGGTRQVNYRMVAGEATWLLKPVSSQEF